MMGWFRRPQLRFDMCGDSRHGHFYYGVAGPFGVIDSKNKGRSFLNAVLAAEVINQRRRDYLCRVVEATDLPDKTEEEIDREKPPRFEMAALEMTNTAIVPHGVLFGRQGKMIDPAFSKAVADQLLTKAVSVGEIAEADRERIAGEIAATNLPDAESDVDKYIRALREDLRTVEKEAAENRCSHDSTMDVVMIATVGH